MITSILLRNCASYGPNAQTLADLKTVNFVYGSNATGKTTISRLIDRPENYAECTLTWSTASPLKTVVYNKDFVEQNFNQVAGLPGVFTLGRENVEATRQIESLNSEQTSVSDDLLSCMNQLDGSEVGTTGKQQELTQLDNAFKDKCWTIKTKHDEVFRAAFEPNRGSSARFRDEVLRHDEENTAELLELTDLVERASTVFDSESVQLSMIEELDDALLTDLQNNSLLSKPIVGREDVDIAGLINKLGNSDWVQRGRGYLSQSEGLCPFCQRTIDEELEVSLGEYFDGSYDSDKHALGQLVSEYSEQADHVCSAITRTLEESPQFLDTVRLSQLLETLKAVFAQNNELLERKARELSSQIELVSVLETLSQVNDVVRSANRAIQDHNALVENRTLEEFTLRQQIWKFVVTIELGDAIEAYRRERAAVLSAIDSLQQAIQTKQGRLREIEREIQEQEGLRTGIEQTMHEVNSILSSFGFQSFRLDAAGDGPYYKLVRSDGSDARETLSEGEKTFITFLYFYHFLQGGESSGTVTESRVVVFDDPISSLDSDILFLVSSLIQRIFDLARSDEDMIRQVFVLTHNVYFHREVTFNKRRNREQPMNWETFWLLRKFDGETRVVACDENPIKTSYQLLWAEIRNPEQVSSQTIQNTLRRILENYFKFFGGVDPRTYCDRFEGHDRLICQSLFQWVNAGSHLVDDDLYVAVDDVTVEAYLRVFRAIFEVSNHIEHYLMMMGESEEQAA